KKAGDPVYSNNLVNIISFINDYEVCYPDDEIECDFDSNIFFSINDAISSGYINNVIIESNPFEKDMFLYISHNPKDVLNISISKFYSSCQDLYGGGYRNHVLSNVFDPNSVPAFLIFDSPILNLDSTKISDILPIARRMIRSIELESKTITHFDR